MPGFDVPHDRVVESQRSEQRIHLRSVRCVGNLHPVAAHASRGEPRLGLRNGVQTALAIHRAASENRVSRGCHYRVDSVNGGDRLI